MHILLAVGMRNSIVNTYLIDEMEEQKVINFRSFMRDKWDLWMGKCIIQSYNILQLIVRISTVMSMIVTIFVINEYKTYPIT